MADPFIGQIKMFAGNFAPQGYAFCEGQLLPISQHDVLFSLLGTTYGGDGQQTFALPDLRGRLPLHQGQGPGLSKHSPGQTGGSETVTLQQQEIPLHTHQASANTAGDSLTPVGNAWSAHSGGQTAAYATSANATLAANAIGPDAGRGQPHENRQPYLAINFIIALEGIYPSRN
jgi:microcystin-dependent protein